MDNGRFTSRQSSSKRTHKQTLKKLEGNIRRLSSDVDKLYHDVSCFTNACNEPKPSPRTLYETMATMTHHIGNLSIDEYKLNKNVRQLTRTARVVPKMVSFQEELEREGNKEMCKNYPTLFTTTTPAKERKAFLSKVNRFSKHLSESPKCAPILPAPVEKNRKSMDYFLNDTVGRNPMIMKPSRSLCCSTIKKDFDQCKSREQFGCRDIDDPGFRCISVGSATKVDMVPSFSRFDQFTADYDHRSTVKWRQPPTSRSPPSFSGFLHKSVVVDKCVNVASCDSGVVGRKRNDVGTSHPPLVHHCTSSTEMISKHINSLNNKTVLMPLKKLEKNYDRDMKHKNPLGNTLISAIVSATRSCHSVSSQHSSPKRPSQECPPKRPPIHTECLPAVWPLECLTTSAPPKWPPSGSSTSADDVYQMVRTVLSCTKVGGSDIRPRASFHRNSAELRPALDEESCPCGLPDCSCIYSRVHNILTRLIRYIDGSEWNDSEWLPTSSMYGLSSYGIMVGSVLLIACVPDSVPDRVLFLLLFLLLTYHHF